jgi:DUF1680 family protein
MVAYFLPLQAGARKIWGTPTDDFWCCHGSLVQAHTLHNAYVYYEDEEGLAVCQYVPTKLEWEWDGVPVTVRQVNDSESSTARPRDPDGAMRRPKRWVIELSVRCEQPVAFALKLRLPWWLSGPATISVNGEPEPIKIGASSFHCIRRTWRDDHIRVEFQKALTACPLPDEPDTVAFMDGPVLLAGLCKEERTLHGDKDDPASMLTPDNEREWGEWKQGYRVRNQEWGLRFKPLYEVVDEPYTVYFPVRSRS